MRLSLCLRALLRIRRSADLVLGIYDSLFDQLAAATVSQRPALSTALLLACWPICVEAKMARAQNLRLCKLNTRCVELTALVLPEADQAKRWFEINFERQR